MSIVSFRSVKQSFWSRLRQGHSLLCPMCKRFAKIYHRQLHHSACRQLILLYTLSEDSEWVHASALVLPDQAGMGDFSKAKHWGLIEQAPKHADIPNGSWRLTTDGIAFVRRELAIPRYVYIFDDTVRGFGDEYWNITQALGQAFDYNELMQ